MLTLFLSGDVDSGDDYHPGPQYPHPPQYRYHQQHPQHHQYLQHPPYPGPEPGHRTREPRERVVIGGYTHQTPL